uniref:Uncharacterized protein n=1 Tax=viral metagenome TaxID=1070528 RepID=A0A6C0E1T1_9ZZZZ
MNEPCKHTTENSDDDGWGFYVVLDVEQSFLNVSSIRTYYTKTVPALPPIEEDDEMTEQPLICTNNDTLKFDLEQLKYIYAVCMISCLYLCVLAMN